MKIDGPLNLIYRHLSETTSEGVVGHYQALYFFSDFGAIPEQVLDKVYENFSSQKTKHNYLFESLEDIGKFAIEVCQEVMAPAVFVVSVPDYNLGLEATSDLKTFREIFKKYGSIIENPDFKEKKGNLLSKFFN